MMIDEGDYKYLDARYVRRQDCEGYRTEQDDLAQDNAMKITKLSTEVKFILGGIGVIIGLLLPIFLSVIGVE